MIDSQDQGPRLTVNSLMSALGSVSRRWTDIGKELRFPEEVIEQIESQGLFDVAAVFKHYLQLHPFASWRRIIRAMERLEEQKIVKQIQSHAETIIDSTLTVENVAEIFSKVSCDWADGVYVYSLAGELLVPLTVQESIKKQYSALNDQLFSLAHYWVHSLFNASWPTLIGALYFLNEKDALEICVQYNYAENDETLTMENVVAACEGVSKWDEVGYRLRVPTAKRNEIRRLYDNDSDRKEAVIRDFLENHPAPTWKEAALALYRMKQHHNVRVLYDQKYLVAPEEQRLLDIFQYAIRKEGFLNQIIMQAIIQGNARSGKTSLIKVLQGKPANPVEPSTAVLKETTRIELQYSTFEVDGILWTPIENLHEEANLVVREVMSCEEPPGDNPINSDEGLTGAVTIGRPVNKIHEEITEKQLILSSSSIFEPEDKAPDNNTITNVRKTVTMPNIFSQAVKKAKLKMKMIRDPWTLYVSDVGGQLEFQELVPALTNGPSIHIIVVAAHWGLNNKCPVEYLHKNGMSAKFYTASYTVKEHVLFTLATIMSAGRSSNLPKAIFVVTFKDRVNDREILQIDKELQDAIKPTDAYRMGVVEFATESNLCHFINNLSPHQDDVHAIRRTIERVGKRNKNYKVRTPYSWLCFSLAIRAVKEKVLDYSMCKSIGRACGIESNEELDAALRFLHYNIGTIRHFSDVSELKDIVIKEPQLLFDCVTDLVLNTFTFEHVYYSAHEDFYRKGLFPAEMVNSISTGSEMFTVDKFIAFLVHHHIIAPLTVEGEVCRYFLPCSLVHAKIVNPVPSVEGYPPLLVVFESGYVPRGIFGYLVSDLLTDKEHDLKVVLDLDFIYRDQLTVSVGPYVDQFTITLHATFIQIDVLPSKIDRKLPFGLICCYVRRRIDEALHEIVENLNYNCKASHSLAFLCPDPCTKVVHPASLSFYHNELQALKCSVSKLAKTLPRGSEMWFNEHYTIRKRACLDPLSELPAKKPVLCHSMIIAGEPNVDCLERISLAKEQLSAEHLQLVRVSLWRARVVWQQLGLALSVDEATLQSIAMTNHHKPEECFTEMLYHWLCRHPVLGELRKSIETLGLPEIDDCYEHLISGLGHHIKENKENAQLNTLSSDEILSTCHLKRLVCILWKAREKWFDIGLALLTDIPTLHCIKLRHPYDPGEGLREVLSHWLNKGNSTIKALLMSVTSLPVRESFPDLEFELADFLQSIRSKEMMTGS